jgi:hypothetical protein
VLLSSRAETESLQPGSEGRGGCYVIPATCRNFAIRVHFQISYLTFTDIRRRYRHFQSLNIQSFMPRQFTVMKPLCRGCWLCVKSRDRLRENCCYYRMKEIKNYEDGATYKDIMPLQNLVKIFEIVRLLKCERTTWSFTGLFSVLTKKKHAKGRMF